VNEQAQHAENTAPATAETLSAAMRRVRALLEARVTGAAAKAEENAAPEQPANESSGLADICHRFGLSDFERDVLVLCAAMELDPAVPSLCAALHGDETGRYPTFQLALEILPGPHWSALLPDAPLRRWRLLEVRPGETLTGSRLRIEERVLHFLMGAQALDPRLQNLLQAVAAPQALPASYREHAEAMLYALTAEQAAVVQLSGDAGKGKRSLAAAACRSLGLHLSALRAGALGANLAEQEEFVRLWEREALLSCGALLLEPAEGNPLEWNIASALAERISGVVLVCGSGPLELSSAKQLVRIEVDRPATDEQRALWQHALGEFAASLNGQLDRIAAQFPLDSESIHNAGQRVMQAVQRSGDDVVARLWDECRAETRPLLEGRAQRIEVHAGWNDIVLPEQSMEMLRSIASHVQQQEKVFQEWGFARQTSRGLGATALFSGPSGTGKTLAAEILAHELRLDLYRINLSQVVSKYIGETEKNLRAIFDAAESSGAILLFDEADALFGKRSEVKDSHDRYANIEVSYLLQRMEAYRGLAILTTNMRHALDQAFLRRIRFIISFPFPDPALRRRIWERIFPTQTPTLGLDAEKLARLNLPGGNIRNIAVNAAFLAADAGGPVRMQHLLVAARRECGKLERQLSDAEVGGWV